METDVLELLDELEEIIDSGTKIPMTGKVLVDDSALFELIDRIRSSLPEEIQSAKWIMNERQKLISEAQAEAQKIVERGKTYIEKMAEENEVVKQAQEYAEEIVRQAQAYAREVKFGAVQYADEVFQGMEKALADNAASIRKNREELRNMVKRDDRSADKGVESRA
ncbi:MAG: ATPase [Desulfitobacterium hafniense]|nr:ATPase [Desulfitobacterium hafniense]